MAANVPKYQQLKEYVIEYIIKENLNAHDPVFTENELVNKFNVSRHTVRKALDELENEGWIYRKQGAGTFCADRSAVKSVDSNNIAVITTYINDYIFPRIIRGIDQVLSKEGYTILLYNTNNRIEREIDILENVLTKNIRGIIIEPTKSALPHINLNYFQEFKRKGIPYIFINSYYDELKPSYVIQDDEAGGFIATEHLIELGHRNIVGIFKSDDNQGLNRYKGYIKALRKHGVRIKEDNIIWYTTEEMKTKPPQMAARIFKEEDEKPTAIVCYNDQIAMWVIEALRNSGLSIPDDVSIVGFDDSDYAVLSDVKLTSVIHPKEEMGREAARILFKLIDMGNKAFEEPINICIKPELKVRTSTKKIDLKEVKTWAN
ncbi:transcriptional regulator, GntR family [Caldanaerobius fijiensis DSM 17918]|uniref:Transcriptional regulator, GntR family n=1 Tax=Caldanaerobius fijiensis DSM 17918 TaxID=1121256 RepID=A0A1M5DA67_9THEO|nr:GntR family transcriptional regulator [Caldanaerobius fijiensis]SHF63878.1 transcriptional regulator, GntR family [Caldanaerobius fijiensis DSM 17918]